MACEPIKISAVPASAVTVTFDRFPSGDLIKSDVILKGSEFLGDGILVAGSPESSYCSRATAAAVRTYGSSANLLTTADPSNVEECNNILLKIQFASPAQSVTRKFIGATPTYTMKAYDDRGALLGTVQQDAVFGDGTFKISYSSLSTNIDHVTFGRRSAITAVTAIVYGE